MVKFRLKYMPKLGLYLGNSGFIVRSIREWFSHLSSSYLTISNFTYNFPIYIFIIHDTYTSPLTYYFHHIWYFQLFQILFHHLRYPHQPTLHHKYILHIHSQITGLSISVVIHSRSLRRRGSLVPYGWSCERVEHSVNPSIRF